MTLSLRQALGGFYADHVLRGEPKEKAIKAIRLLIDNDPEAKAAAVEKLDALNKLDAGTGGRLSQRCYVSHIHKMALEGVLND